MNTPGTGMARRGLGKTFLVEERQMQSYDYGNRQGIEEISWERFAQLSGTLAEKLSQQGVEIIIGIARAGLFPATAVACMLRRELYPVRITRRVDDWVMFAHPVWRVDVSPDVEGKVVAVVDEIADTGESLVMVAERVRERGASRVLTASLVAHSWSDPIPDQVALVSDALILFPWDRKVYVDGHWQPHPELEDAIRLQEPPEGKNDEPAS